MPFRGGIAPKGVQNDIVAAFGEFVGTFLFLFFAFAGTQLAKTPPVPEGTTSTVFVALVFGMSLMANAWAFYRVTGGLFNPAVTLALWLVGPLTAIRAGIFMIAQLLGGLCAAAVVSALFPGPMTVETTLGGGTSIAQGLFIEMFLTAELVFVVLMLAAEKHKATYLAPVGIGISFFLCELVGAAFTGGSLNPARSLGPAAVNHSFPGYFWIYWLGPALGSLLACGFYALLKLLRYENLNIGQDQNEVEKVLSQDPTEANKTAACAMLPNPNDPSHTLAGDAVVTLDRSPSPRGHLPV